MEPIYLVIPLFVGLGFIPLSIRLRATRGLRSALEEAWTPIAERWGLGFDKHRWYVSLHYRGQHDGRMTRLIAYRSLLGNDVRSWRPWFAVIVELESTKARLAPTQTDGYIFGAADAVVTVFRPGFARQVGVIPGEKAMEWIPGVRVDGAPPELTPEIERILETWFVPGHGFVSDNGVCIAWNPESLPGVERVEAALQDATQLAAWLSEE